jgi:hypothetical protein
VRLNDCTTVTPTSTGSEMWLRRTVWGGTLGHAWPPKTKSEQVKLVNDAGVHRSLVSIRQTDQMRPRSSHEERRWTIASEAGEKSHPSGEWE